jgi:predicted enzyme related to lactoylglutathione lyase
MSSPITNHISGIFVHVKDIRRSIQWYSQLLGVTEVPASHEDTIYDVPMLQDRGSALILDANTYLTQPDGRHPQFMFDTTDIHKAYQFLQEKGVKLLSGIEDGGSVSFFALEDPDGTILMVCQNRVQTS